MKQILTLEYSEATIEQDGIFACKQGCRKKYDLEGNVVEDFVVCGVKPLQYDTNKYSDNESIIYNEALCVEYFICYNQYGLMTPSGKPITTAIYTNIQAISKDSFLCGIGLNEYVILDNSGHKVTK